MQVESNANTKVRSGRRPRETRERQLIEAAIHCISVRGLRDTTVPDVAVRANMAVGAVCASYDQRHDERLESLCRALITDGHYELEPSIAAQIVGSQCHGLAALFPRHAAAVSGSARAGVAEVLA